MIGDKLPNHCHWSHCTKADIELRGMGMKSAETRIQNVLEMKCLRSLDGVSRMES